MIGNHFRTVVVSVLTAMLTACVSLQPPLPLAGSFTKPGRTLPLQQLQYWRARGSVIIATEENSVHARFNWQQTGQNYTIDFFGPLGTYHAKLFGAPGCVTLIDPQNHRTTAASPDALIAKTLGWQLPVENLYDWMRGIPKQAPGWYVEYGNFIFVKGYYLPQSMSLTYPNLKIKIKIDQWEV